MSVGDDVADCVDDTASMTSMNGASDDDREDRWYPGKVSHVCIISHQNVDKTISTVELSYIGQECHSIPAILGRIYGNQTRRLDFSFNTLKVLEGLEAFPFLEELILDNNELDDTGRFVPLPNLHTLSINKNRISDLDNLLRQLSKCYPKLTYLSLLGNPACPDQLSNLEKDEGDYARYRYYVLHHVPELKFLDSTSVKQIERHESKRIGSFMKVVKPKYEIACEANNGNNSQEYAHYSPLPTHSKKEGTHKGSFGKLRQRYTGTQSEGNRFIRDQEL